MSLCQIEVKRDITNESTLANKDPRVIYDKNIEMLLRNVFYYPMPTII